MSLHIGIAGAGLAGRLLAWRLARAGHRVDVFDVSEGPQRPAHGPWAAGFTAAGMLSPLAELDCGDESIATLGWRSLALWPQWLRQLERPVHFAQRGSLLVCHGADRVSAERVLARLRQQAPDADVQPWSTASLQQHEPSVAPNLLAWHLPREGQIHAVQAMQALAEAGTRAGVRWHWRSAVDAVHAGRLTIDARPHAFDLAVDTRGLGARVQSPTLRSVRGEIFWLHAPGVALHRPLRLLHPRHRVYLVPRPDDLIVVGASEIESDDASPVSLRSTVELLAAAHSVLPELAEARVVHSEANCRPAYPDNLPQLHREPGLLRLNGLFRHGWLIAPALVDDAVRQLEPACAAALLPTSP